MYRHGDKIYGPFSGLEMQDRYSSFQPNVLVKKSEDPEFEPLGQFVRRIANTREPFLVPQIGIAHRPFSSEKLVSAKTKEEEEEEELERQISEMEEAEAEREKQEAKIHAKRAGAKAEYEKNRKMEADENVRKLREAEREMERLEDEREKNRAENGLRKRQEPSAFTLQMISPSVRVDSPIIFENILPTTTVKQVKAKFRDAIPSKPEDELQRLVHRGRILARETETMLDIFGEEAVTTKSSPVKRCVLISNVLSLVTQRLRRLFI